MRKQTNMQRLEALELIHLRRRNKVRITGFNMRLIGTPPSPGSRRISETFHLILDPPTA
jgi:hypothetical protein